MVLDVFKLDACVLTGRIQKGHSLSSKVFHLQSEKTFSSQDHIKRRQQVRKFSLYVKEKDEN